MSVSHIVRGGFWLYGSSIISSICGFFYWMIISAIGGSSVIGAASAVVGFATLITGLLSFGVGIGVQRFLGKYISENNHEEITKYFWSTAMFTIVIYCLAGVALYASSFLNYSLGGISPTMVQVASIVVLLGSMSVFSALLISYLKTNITFLGIIVGVFLKFTVGIILVYLNWDWIGVVLGYACMNLACLAIYSWYSIQLIGFKPKFSLKALHDVLIAGISNWLPGLILLAGQWIGVLAVFSVSGAAKTGYYYVAFAISNVVLMISKSMLSLLLPVLSGINVDAERRKVGWRTLRLCLTFMFPIATSLMVYSWLPLSLLGREYISASIILITLLLAAAPIAIIDGVNSFVYAAGMYSYVLTIGLAQNLPRIALYLVLTPLYEGLGAALSYTIGGFVGLCAVLWISRKVNFKINWYNVATIIGIPGSISFICWFLNLHWFLGIIAILGVSTIGYAKLNVLTKNDLKELTYALAPKPIIDKVYVKIKPFIDLLYPD